MFNCNDPVLLAEADAVNKPKLQYLSVNQPFAHITAYSVEELLGNTGILKAAKTNPAVIAQICSAMTAWQPVCAEFVNYSQDGSECWVELNLAPVANEMGNYTHWISIERDISARKRMEVALKQQTSGSGC